MKLSARIKPWLLLTPALLFLLLPLYGLWSAFRLSVYPDGKLTGQVYVRLFSHSDFLLSFLYSLWVAAASTFLSLLIGWFFTRAFVPMLERTGGRLTVWLPMVFPHFVWAYLVLLLFQEGGLVSGLLPGNRAYANDPEGIGIILTYMGKEIPFVILMLLPVYLTRNRLYDDLTETLGGSWFSKIRDAELPFVTPVLIETGIIIFAFTFGAYEVPALVGATFPEMLSILTFDWFYSGDWSERPLAFAAMVFLTTVIGVISLLLFHFINKMRRNITEGL
ncbi:MULTISPECIES: ABC transporter permease [Salimicrobium]|uniref:ABC transporter permease n=1 Tax=Salimicrobium humidisoli TaxID=2029857 RepID=A0ABX4HVM2_9BACI|nr:MULTISPECIES: ABC transporter permease [Salimicrobium]PBB06536.1 ABC transporter permease [Salimicrobium humidisoli]